MIQSFFFPICVFLYVVFFVYVRHSLYDKSSKLSRTEAVYSDCQPLTCILESISHYTSLLLFDHPKSFQYFWLTTHKLGHQNLIEQYTCILNSEQFNSWKVPKITIFARRTWFLGAIATHRAGLQRETFFLDSPIPIFWFGAKKTYSAFRPTEFNF